MAPEVSVVFAAFNEEDLLRVTVEEVLEALRASWSEVEILVVENGSTDGTGAIAAALASDHAEVRVARLELPDYGAALRHGILATKGRVVVNFDVDYYDVAFLDRAVGEIHGGAAVVVGAKRDPSSVDDRPVGRRLGTAVFSLVLRIFFGLRTSDTHGMKALDIERIRPLAEQCQLTKDLFDTELLLRAERAGLPIVELPVHVEERRPARSSVVRRILRTPVGLVNLRRALVRR